MTLPNINARKKIKAVLSRTVPNQPGVYVLMDGKGFPLYLGRAERSLRERIVHHVDPSHDRGKLGRRLLESLSYFDFAVVRNRDVAKKTERKLIHAYKPRYNKLSVT
jgi:excinuclease ABC subunit C